MNADPLLLFKTGARGLQRRELRRFARQLLDSVAPGHTFCALITTDEALRRLNLQFRGLNYATDVLSFPAPSPGGGLGDIAISAGQAAAQGRDAHTEIKVLLLHGLLHLLGHDHETDGGRMRRLETRWRKRLDLPGGLIERAGGRRGGAR